MQDHPLLISSLIRHAAEHHGARSIVSRLGDGSIHRTTYADIERRARRLANLLISLGVQPGDRIGTLAWNTYRHLECFYGVSGMGAVLHTINPRLFKDQIAYIIEHAEDRILLVDADLLPIVEAVGDRIRHVEHVIVLTTRDQMPHTDRVKLECYEELVEYASDDYDWPQFDERVASSLCYTSGTTGHPKGVLYSHRSTLLHAMCSTMPDSLALGCRDVVLPIAPMFHVNAWSLPYGCAMVGAKLVLPGNRLDAASLHELIESEGVTFAGGVPTVWTMLINYLKDTGKRIDGLERTVIGGAALPPAIEKVLREDYGVRTIHAWGMTEMSPIGTLGMETPEVAALSEPARRTQLLKQGRVPYGVEMKIVDAEGRIAPRDGSTFGAVWVRGHWIASAYYRGEGGDVLDEDGWFPTGDVATWDEYGYMKITDRTKDVIKSGGEWISSIDVENAAMSHPQVAFAAAIAAYHPKWDERPVLVVVPVDGESPTREDIVEFLESRMAKWWLPDDVIFIKEMPLTATGKILKAKLRQQYWEHLAAP